MRGVDWKNEIYAMQSLRFFINIDCAHDSCLQVLVLLSCILVFFFIKKYFFSLKVVSCNVILCIDCKRILEKENGLTEHGTILYEVGAEFVLGTI